VVVACATVFHLRRRTLPRHLVVVFAIGSASLIAYTFTRPGGMYSGDESIKLAQSIAILDGQVALTYPGAALDPEKHHFPHGPPYAVIEEGRFYGVYSPLFTVPTALTWAVCGYWGLYVCPVLGGIAMLWYAMRLAHRIAPRLSALTIGVLVTTPAVLNAALFNEHAAACGLVAFALVHGASVRRGALLASGAAASLAIAIRPELVTAIPALIVFFVASADDGIRPAARRMGWMLVGGIAPLATYVIVNLATVGVPSPVMHATYVPLRDAAWGLDIVPAETVSLTGVAPVWLFVPLVLAFVPPRHARVCTLVLALAAVAWLVVDAIYLDRVTRDDFLHPAALLAATPLFALGLAHGPYAASEQVPLGCGARLPRALWLFAITGIVAMMAVNTSMGHGARIGARFILVYLPALAIVSMIVANRSRLLQAIAALAVALGIWAQLLEHRQLGRARGRSAAVVAALRSRPELHVFSGLTWGPQVAGPVWNEKQIFNSSSSIGPLLAEIKRRGSTTVLELVGGLDQWQKLGKAPRVEQVPIDLGTPRVRVYRFVE
jgi:hypothetical protein